MGTLLPENLCAHRKGEIEELIKGRAREMAAQPQILFGKLTGDQDGLEELLEKLMTPLTESLSHVLMSSCEVCGVSQISNQVRSPIGDQRSVDPGESSKRPAAEDRSGCCKRRCTDKHDQGCQATKQVLRIQEAPQMYPTNYFDHHTCRAYSPNNPSQNPLLEPYLLGFPSMTVTTQYLEPSSRSFASMTISTQDSESYPRSFSSKTQDLEPYRLSFSSMTISTQDSEPYSEESVQSNSVSGDLQFLPPLRFSKQKVVIKVPINGRKSRTKAMKIAVSVQGVESAALGGQDMNQIEVIGDGIDAVALTTLLRKNVGYSELVTVGPVPEKKDEATVQIPLTGYYNYPPYVPQYAYEIRDQNPDNCSIM